MPTKYEARPKAPPNRIDAMIEARAITRAELARRAGLTKRGLRMVADRSHRPQRETAQKIADALGEPLLHVFPGGTGPRRRHPEVTTAESVTDSPGNGSHGGRLLLTTDEAADLLGLTRRQILTLAREHEIPHVKVGRYVKFRRESLAAWVERREVGA